MSLLKNHLLLSLRRLFSSLSEGEILIEKTLKQKFPQNTCIKVQDVSGGCGAMYEVLVESPEFQGKSRLLQHRLVNEALKEEIKDMHGIRISTAISNSDTKPIT